MWHKLLQKRFVLSRRDVAIVRRCWRIKLRLKKNGKGDDSRCREHEKKKYQKFQQFSGNWPRNVEIVQSFWREVWREIFESCEEDGGTVKKKQAEFFRNLWNAQPN